MKKDYNWNYFNAVLAIFCLWIFSMVCGVAIIALCYYAYEAIIGG